MNRQEYIQIVVEAYLDLPDTPSEASPGDLRVVASLADGGVPAEHVIRAIKLAFVRRWARDDSAGNLPMIRSFAYFKKVLGGLSEEELSDDFAVYVDLKFNAIRPNPSAWFAKQKTSNNDHQTPNNKIDTNDQISLFLGDR